MAKLRQLWQEFADYVRADRDLAGSLVVYGVVTALAVGVLVLGAIFAFVVDIPGSVLTREPQVTLGGAFYTGALSNLGALVWMVGVTMSMVGWSMASDRAMRHTFLAGGLVGAVLLFDDFFLFHDWVRLYSRFLDRFVLFVYLLMVIGLILRFWRTMGPVTTFGVVGTLGMLALSAAFDLLFNDLDQLIEDGFKFVGICLWSTSWTLLARPWRARGLVNDLVHPPAS